jgi:hypothetical protein
MRRVETLSPQDPDPPLRPHGNLGPNEGEGKEGALKLKNSTLLNRCFLVKQYIPSGEIASDWGHESASVPDTSRETVFAIAK